MADKDKGERATGPAYSDRGAEPDEIARYQEILARESSSLVFAALAEAYRKRNMLDQAIAVCRKGLHHHPDFVSGRVALARAYVEKGETERATRELERVILSAPDNLVAQRLLLSIYEARGDRDSLEETLHRILSLDPHDEVARKAWERLQPRRWNEGGGAEEAEGGAREIVTQTLAEIYASQGYHEKAFEIYQKLSVREPANPVIHARIADLKQKAVHRDARMKGREEEKGFSAD
jgi:tetratricopeptide (TPR) repeat protein